MTSRLAEIQARFQQRQMQEREEKLLKLYENQQQRAFEKVGRGSAGSNTSSTSGGSTGGGKVRQMFDERRQKAGIDKSYPLEPLKARTNNRVGGKNNSTTTSRTVIKSTVQKSVSSVRNGKAVASKREVVQNIYNNNDGDESYEEHRYQDDNTDMFNSKSHRDIIDMMNDHNLKDDLDNEVLPQIGFDEVDKPRVAERDTDDSNANVSIGNANVSGGAAKISNASVRNGNTTVLNSKSGATNVKVKSPSQNGVVRRSVDTRPATKSNGATTTRRESNPAPKKPVRASPARTVSSPSQSPRASAPMSPAKSPNLTMQSKSKPATAPLNTRPSAKQSVKSAVVRDDLAECGYCGRRFAADRLQKHEDICSKTGKKKRKVYDATKHRVAGTELETYVLRGPKGKSSISTKSAKQATKKDWRKTHEEFIAAIRSAKQTQAHLAKGGKLSDLPPPPPSSNPDYVQCPHCGRRFNEAAAERHIPKCATFQFNKPKPGAPAKGARR